MDFPRDSVSQGILIAFLVFMFLMLVCLLQIFYRIIKERGCKPGINYILGCDVCNNTLSFSPLSSLPPDEVQERV